MLAEVARALTPRIEVWGAREIALDLSGLAHLLGDGQAIAEQARRLAADRGLHVRVAIAGTRTAARLLVRHRAGLTVIEPGTEACALAPLPLALLGEIVETSGGADRAGDVRTFRRWGLQTLGELAALPPDELAARLGRDGPDWQRLARGEDPRPLVRAVPDERFEQALDLEWPIEGLEPLSFVLGRLMEPLAAHLEQRDRGAAVLHVRLQLVTQGGEPHAVHERSLQLPAPIRDARTLRTLALLDLESHPPPAAIDRVTVAVDPTPGRIVQYSLLARPLPSPEQISTLMARLQALMGETRCGSPVPIDSWHPGAFTMKPFNPSTADVEPSVSTPQSPGGVPPIGMALRRFRRPVSVRVGVDHGRPSSVSTLRREIHSGGIDTCAGPWRTSGEWWQAAWDRDEWDVTLAGGTTYRLFRERTSNQWFIDGVVD
jgi:protein ImuB